MKKNRIRLTESQLHRVIKEAVKDVLKNKDNLSDIYDEYQDDDYVGKYTYEPVCNMVDRLRGRDASARWDNFDKSIKNNRNMKKWYDNLHKEGQKKYSWDLFDDYAQDVKRAMSPKYYDTSEEYVEMSNPNMYDTSQYTWDDYDEIMNDRH